MRVTDINIVINFVLIAVSKIYISTPVLTNSIKQPIENLCTLSPTKGYCHNSENYKDNRLEVIKLRTHKERTLNIIKQNKAHFNFICCEGLLRTGIRIVSSSTDGKTIWDE